MKTDAVVLGAELDALVAALRLRELGHSVRLLSTGSGSLHYASGGVHVLGYTSPTDSESVRSPLTQVEELNERHPYRLVGRETIARSLNWFFETATTLQIDFRHNGDNMIGIAPSGSALPVYGPTATQATRELTDAKQVTVVRFRGHRDFPADLVAGSLTERGCAATVVEVTGPASRTDSVTLARALDDPMMRDSYFAGLRAQLPNDSDIVVFPAVLGLRHHRAVVASAQHRLGVPCLELPTLPPGVPGMRLHQAFETRLAHEGVSLHIGAGFGGAQTTDGRCDGVADGNGRIHQGSVFVVATGGVLMGGLQVEASGQIRESALGLEVVQTQPLAKDSVDQSLDALHRTGIETDVTLRACRNGAPTFDNVFVAGRSLAHWNPAAELSSEGVSIATGWQAAQSAHHYLRD